MKGHSVLPETRASFLRSHGLKLFISLFLVMAALAVFWQVRNHEFIHLDDDEYITDNPRVKIGLTLGNVMWAFTTTHAGNWHPLTWLSHMLDVELYGLRPGGHHLTNLLLHVANTLPRPCGSSPGLKRPVIHWLWCT